MTFDAACADACAVAYLDPPTWQAGDAYAVISQSDDITIVAFRGTESLADFVIDFSFRPAWHDDLGWCHEGFLSDVTAIAPQMLAEIAGKRVAVTGHSKGGGEALIFAGLMVASGHIPETVVTFGAPRPGFSKLRDLLLPIRSIPQYRHGNDPVPPMIPEILFYRHAREPLIQFGTYTFDPFDCHCLASYRAALPV
jgi:hypothetical protein